MWAEHRANEGRAKQPSKRGRRQEAEQGKRYFRIGAEVEKEIPSTLKQDKLSIVTARRRVSERTRLQFDVVAKYHQRYRRATQRVPGTKIPA